MKFTFHTIFTLLLIGCAYCFAFSVSLKHHPNKDGSVSLLISSAKKNILNNDIEAQLRAEAMRGVQNRIRDMTNDVQRQKQRIADKNSSSNLNLIRTLNHQDRFAAMRATQNQIRDMTNDVQNSRQEAADRNSNANQDFIKTLNNDRYERLRAIQDQIRDITNDIQKERQDFSQKSYQANQGYIRN